MDDYPSEGINQPYVVFQSGNAAITNAAAITYSGSGNSWNAKYTVNSGDTNGAITFTVDISDNAGNTNQKTATTNSSSVTKVDNVIIGESSGEQVGGLIQGESDDDYFGYNMVLSSNNNTIAVAHLSLIHI